MAKEAPKSSLEQLIPLAYDELRRIARQRMSQLHPDGTLAPTDLVHEVLMRLLKQCDQQTYNGKDHLIRVAAIAMHNVLVDIARRRAAVKRGGQGRRIDLNDDLPIAAPAEDMLSFHEGCEAARAHSEQHFELIMLRVYAGMTLEQIAALRGQSTRTVERHWRFVKAILNLHLHAADSQSARSPDKIGRA